MEDLYKKLKAYGRSDYYPFHMPGHKRNKSLIGEDLPYEIDITEIDGFDDLHHPEGILLDMEKRAAKLYGAEESRLLVNGSTVGILSGILGCTEKGGRILMARNCHKSVYHGVILQELEPYYVYPSYDVKNGINGQIRPEDVEEILKKISGIQAVVLPSPTYDGVVSDIRSIAEIVHKYGIPLIVDEAHGAHFGFHPWFPENSNTKGADVVIHSLHKTMPAFTQSALLHMNGNLIDREAIDSYLDMLQTSSPSYILMAGIDICLKLAEDRKGELFAPYVDRLGHVREKLKALKHLRLIPDYGDQGWYDRSKILISTEGTDMAGGDLTKSLRERYHLEPEMTAENYVLLMTSPGDREEGFRRLEDALFEIDGTLEDRQASDFCPQELPVQKRIFTPAQMRQKVRMEKRGKSGGCIRSLEWMECAGYISTEYAYLYPPGIPLVVPGELISQKAAGLLERYQTKGLKIEGNHVEKRIQVWING